MSNTEEKIYGIFLFEENNPNMEIQVSELKQSILLKDKVVSILKPKPQTYFKDSPHEYWYFFGDKEYTEDELWDIFELDSSEYKIYEYSDGKIGRDSVIEDVYKTINRKNPTCKDGATLQNIAEMLKLNWYVRRNAWPENVYVLHGLAPYPHIVFSEERQFKYTPDKEDFDANDWIIYHKPEPEVIPTKEVESDKHTEYSDTSKRNYSFLKSRR